VWADDFVGEMKDVFSMQEQTAAKIADALNVRMSPEEQHSVQQRYTQNPQAYEEYLQGNALLLHEDQPENLAAAEKHFQRALELDANYAPAMAGLAQVEGLTYRNLNSDPTYLVGLESYAKRAVTLAPDLSQAHSALGRLYGVRYDYASAIREFREAVRLNPSDPDALDALAWALAYLQPPDAVGAEKAAREAIRLEPSRFAAHYHLGRALMLQGRYQEAETTFQKARELSPASSMPNFGLGQLALAQGDSVKAIALLEKQPANNDLGMFWLGCAYAAHGDKDKALMSIENAFRRGYRDFASVESSPYLTSLRSDPNSNSYFVLTLINLATAAF
jgi:Flp pilus assembly protein TadD